MEREQRQERTSAIQPDTYEITVEVCTIRTVLH